MLKHHQNNVQNIFLTGQLSIWSAYNPSTSQSREVVLRHNFFVDFWGKRRTPSSVWVIILVLRNEIVMNTDY